MQGKKKWWESKTIWGVILSAMFSTYTVLGMALRLFGVVLPPLPAGIQEQAISIILAIVGIVGSVLGVFGRIKAEDVIE
jgi:hypothetical protein